VLRVLGDLLGVAGFQYDSAEEARNEALGGRDVRSLLGNGIAVPTALRSVDTPAAGVQRIGDVPSYFADSLVRRSEPLQHTRDGAPPVASMNSDLMRKRGIAEGDRVRIAQEGGEALLTAVLDERIPADCVRIPAAHAATSDLGPLFATVTVTRVPASEKVMA
jgi:NADH-quinone oxidoreductase subunit G